jgi:hypothetical protein
MKVELSMNEIKTLLFVINKDKYIVKTEIELVKKLIEAFNNTNNPS